MEILNKPPSSMPLMTLSSRQEVGTSSLLKPGQLLNAVVEGRGSDGSLSLQINERTLKVVSEMQLMQGSRIEVKVELKGGQLALRLITPPDEPFQGAQQALRQVLPKQQPMQPLFTQLARIASQPQPQPQATKDTGPQAKAAAEQPAQPAVASRPDTAQLKAEAKQAAASARVVSEALTTRVVSPRVLIARAAAPLIANQHTPLPTDVESLPPLPLKVREAVVELLSRLPNAQKLATPEGIKQAIDDSGLFFESRLAQGVEKGALQGDVKTILFRLASLLRQSLKTLAKQPPPLPPARPDAKGGGKQGAARPAATAGQAAAATAKQAESTALLQLLSRQSESSLARVQMNQLTSLNAQQQGDETVLALELPLFNGKESELLEMTIRREGKRTRGGEEACWSVTLKLDNDDYGAIRAVVTLVGRKVSTTFWCEQAEAQQLFQQHLEKLRARMGEQGLELGRTQALVGLPPEPDGPGSSPTDDGLFHIQA